MAERPHDVPFWADGWRVDEVIECMSFDLPDQRVEAALMEAAPDACEDDNYNPDGGCIIEDRTEYRTSETFERHSLAAAWGKLPPEIQASIIRAHCEQYPDE